MKDVSWPRLITLGYVISITELDIFLLLWHFEKGLKITTFFVPKKDPKNRKKVAPWNPKSKVENYYTAFSRPWRTGEFPCELKCMNTIKTTRWARKLLVSQGLWYMNNTFPYTTLSPTKFMKLTACDPQSNLQEWIGIKIDEGNASGASWCCNGKAPRKIFRIYTQNYQEYR